MVLELRCFVQIPKMLLTEFPREEEFYNFTIAVEAYLHCMVKLNDPLQAPFEVRASAAMPRCLQRSVVVARTGPLRAIKQKSLSCVCFFQAHLSGLFARNMLARAHL